MTLRSTHCALILSMFALPACGSDDNTAPTGTGGYGGLGGSSGVGNAGKAGATSSGGTTPGSGGTTPGSGGTTPGSGGAQSGGAAGAAAGGTAGAAGAAGSAGTAGTAGSAGTAGAGGSLADGGSDDASIEPDGSAPDADVPDGTVPPPDAADGAPPLVNCTGATTLDITSSGAVTASSTSNSVTNNWRPTRATDGNAMTAWYGGNNISPVTFTWTDGNDDCITEIDTTNTAAVNNRSNWGYESVTVRVLNASGTEVFTRTQATPGLTDSGLMITIPGGGVVGRRVTLAFSGLEQNRMTGGIAELNVKGKR